MVEDDLVEPSSGASVNAIDSVRPRLLSAFLPPLERPDVDVGVMRLFGIALRT
jgi:hypothetical protein